MQGTKRIFIAGNGPSMREVDFNNLKSMDWLGMNAAYRHWDKIGIYPNVYSCLDRVVIKSHAKEILRLLTENRVKTFFLVRDILDVIPDFPIEDRVYFLEDLAESEKPGAEIFKTAFSDKKTTGSWAVRFAIFLGYTEIFLCGIDASYVEVIKGAERTGTGLELKIGSEISNNPNYFFDDYQKPGDLYQIPNPARHFGNLHLQSFEALNIDLKRLGLPVSIKNTAKTSQLHRFGVYEYVPLDMALRSPALGAVAVPLTVREHELLIRNFRLWDSPAFHPLRLDSPLRGKIALHVFFDAEPDNSIVHLVKQAWEATRALKFMFSKLEITFLSIPDSLNYYARDARQVDIPRKMGPNLHFMAMMRCCRHYRYIQLLETDCVPAKADWLTDLNRYCVDSDKFWISGAFLGALHGVSSSFAMHINGNAIYASGDQEFQDFINNVFVPALRHMIFDLRDYHLAYDCLISKVIAYGMSASKRISQRSKTDTLLMCAFQEIQHSLDKFRPVAWNVNLSHRDTDIDEDQLLQLLEKDLILIHSRKLDDLLATTCARSLDSVESTVDHPVLAKRFRDTFIKFPNGEIFPFHYYSNLESLTFDTFDRSTGTICVSDTGADQATPEPDKGVYVLFSVDHDVTGHRLDCHIRLLSTNEQVVHARFARHGHGQFAEDGRQIALSPESPADVTLSFVCRDDYSRVRVFLKPVGGQSGKIKASIKIVDRDQSGISAAPVIVGQPDGDTAELYDLFALDALDSAAPPASASGDLDLAIAKPTAYPKLLIIDPTPVGHSSATGQVKQALLGDWPAEAWMQIWEAGGARRESLRLLVPSQTTLAADSGTSTSTKAEIVARCRSFKPDVAYVRPTDSPSLLELAQSVADERSLPLVVHMMDDWPERLRHADPVKHTKSDRLLRSLLAKSQARLCISEAMAAAYKVRYGGDWIPLANGIRPDVFRPKDRRQRPPVSRTAPFVFRYMGALAGDMTFSSVHEVAKAISGLSARLPVQLEIYTMPWFKERAVKVLGALEGVSVHDLVPLQEYHSTLCGADALVLAYNFDADSLRYMAMSLANKMPECLASGAPLLAYGPAECATIRYLEDCECAIVVKNRSQDELREALESLVGNPSLCAQISAKARAHATDKLNVESVQKAFLTTMRAAAFGAQATKPDRGMRTSSQSIGPTSANETMKPESTRVPNRSASDSCAPCLGPFGREAHAHLDETDVVAMLPWPRLDAKRVMIDVGAHFGTSLAHFLDKGWSIFAFEPDKQNRAKLLARLAEHENGQLVTVDVRAVSNKTQQGLTFYSSDVSTGISGLSAFHPSHHESQRVDTISLSDYFGSRELQRVDFLKIDTEGHDLFVLQGFPWDRLSPGVIECEFEDLKTVPLGYTFHDLAGYLASKGYTVYVSEWHPVLRYGIRHDWNRLSRYPCELANDKGWGNLLAFREPVDEAVLVRAAREVMLRDERQWQARQPKPAPSHSEESIPALSVRPDGTHYRVVAAPCFTHVAGDAWQYQPTDANRYWQACFDVNTEIAGRSFAGGIRISADHAVTVSVSLARHGTSDYEGVSERVSLVPGAPADVLLRKKFARSHGALKLQVEIVDSPDGAAPILTMHGVFICETASSVAARIESSSLTLKHANRLFREGDLYSATAIYLTLYNKSALNIYADNALMGARGLGITQVQSIDELVHRLN